MKIFIRKIIIILIIIISMLGIYFYIKKQRDELYTLVIQNRSDWDIFIDQNTIMSGDFTGMIYEKDYTLDTLPKNYLMSLIVDYYINETPNFFTIKNMDDNNHYSTTVSSKDLENIITKMFGPDTKITLEDIQYGCGRSLIKDGEDYIIRTDDPDACGVFDIDPEFYLSHIYSYSRIKDQIIIKIKVGYIKTSTNENGDVESYDAYTDKTMKKLIQKNMNHSCVDDDNKDEKCYRGFNQYMITLEKASDENYYFSKIERQS